MHMKLQSLLLVFAFCMSAEAADNMSLMKFKATQSCEGCDLSNANLLGLDLSGANLLTTDLSYAYLTDATLRNANLSGATLYNTNLADANLTNINLSKAKFCKTTLPWGVDNSGCL